MKRRVTPRSSKAIAPARGKPMISFWIAMAGLNFCHSGSGIQCSIVFHSAAPKDGERLSGIAATANWPLRTALRKSLRRAGVAASHQSLTGIIDSAVQ